MRSQWRRKKGKKHELEYAGVFGFVALAAVSLWRIVHRSGKKQDRTAAHEVKKISVPDYSKVKLGILSRPMSIREKTAWSMLGVLALMWVAQSFNLTQYYKTSILNSFEKNNVVTTAMSLLDKGYRIGETGPDYFDCSGYVKTVLERSVGLTNLPRTSRDMFVQVGTRIEKENLGVGDLVFFDTFGRGYVTHVGIVVDSDGHFANANSYIGKTMIDDLNTQYWRSVWVGARELQQSDGLTSDQIDRTPVKLASADELKPSIYDTVSFPPSELADPRMNPKNFAATTGSGAETVRETIVTDSVTNGSGSGSEAAPKENQTLKNAFSDVPRMDPHYEATAFLKKNGIINGYEDGTFRSDRTISRVEILKMAFKAFDVSLSGNGKDFPDVPSTHWGQKYIRTAVARGIVSGYPDGNFRPDQIVSRIEALKMLFKSGNIDTSAYKKGLFTDVKSSDWFAPYVQSSVDRNLVSKDSKNFDPTKGMTRGEVAEFLYKLRNK